MASSKAILQNVENYYSKKISENGPGPSGVDWNSKESQWLRFEQFAPLWKGQDDFSLIDFGCGYGALMEFLQEREERVAYLGYDISPAMLSAAEEKFKKDLNVKFTQAQDQLDAADFTVASGLFNVRLQHSESEWKEYVFKTLKEMAELSSKGFGFNILTGYSDKEKMRPDLFYAGPEEMFSFCMKQFGKKVQLIHDYPLYEFTILVRL